MLPVHVLGDLEVLNASVSVSSTTEGRDSARCSQGSTGTSGQFSKVGFQVDFQLPELQLSRTLFPER